MRLGIDVDTPLALASELFVENENDYVVTFFPCDICTLKIEIRYKWVNESLELSRCYAVGPVSAQQYLLFLVAYYGMLDLEDPSDR